MIPDQQSTLDQLWNRISTYRQSQEYLDTMRFVTAMREFSPYNAFLLRIQRPHVRFAATAERFMNEFGRWVRTDRAVHPLVVLRPFGPVDFVYDLEDTDGPELPMELLQPFRASGVAEGGWWYHLMENMRRRGMVVEFRSHDDAFAGQVTRLGGANVPNTSGAYPDIRFVVDLNREHDRAVQFVTLLHELAHVVCGHLGAMQDDDWTDREGLPLDVVEFEAESVAYLVCTRLDLSTPSEEYLADYVGKHGEIPALMSVTTVFTAAWVLEEWTKELSWPKKSRRQATAERVREQRLLRTELEAGSD